MVNLIYQHFEFKDTMIYLRLFTVVKNSTRFKIFVEMSNNGK